MTSSPTPTSQGQAPAPWIDFLTAKQRESAIALFVTTAVLAALPVFLFVAHRETYLGIAIWCLLLPALTLAVGVFQLTREPGEKLGAANVTRILVGTLGAGLGIWLIGLGILLVGVGTLVPGAWWQAYFEGGLDKWREHPWRVLIVLGAICGGLALLFVTSQLVRADVRSSAAMRRILYGYNTALTAFLLLAILVILNLLCYLPAWPFNLMARTSDWTGGGLHSLSDATVGLLNGLDKRTKIYAIQTGNPSQDDEMQKFLDNCQAVTGKLQVEYLSPDRNRQTVEDLVKKYKAVGEFARSGLLIVYGTEPNETYDFLDARQLYFRDDADHRLFDGENALMNKLTFLIEGKSRPRIYFTQGSGEPDLMDARVGRGELGLSVLRGYLEEQNFDVQKLVLTETTERVPDDAAVVVVAGPTRPLPAAGIKALTEYMKPASADPKKQGKLFALLDTVMRPDGKMLQTGVEKLLAEFNVKISDEHLLSLSSGELGSPLDMLVFCEWFLRPRPVQFLFTDVRVVQPQRPEPHPGASPIRVEPFLHAVAVTGEDELWLESDLRSESANGLVADWSKPERKQAFITEKKPQSDFSVGVLVAEVRMEDNRQFAKSRMIVVGTSSWIQNRMTGADRGKLYEQLFHSGLNYLRERPDIGRRAESKVRQPYSLPSGSDEITRLYYQPAVLIFIAIIGLGGGIWLVRRR